MTELEKMLAGELYNAADPELVALHQQARQLTAQLNREEDIERRTQLCYQLLGEAGENLFIETPFACDYGRFIKVGNHFYANVGVTILDCAPVTIGDNVLLAPGVKLLTATHPVSAKLRTTGLEYALPITIGSDCWLGAGCMVGPGVTIGSGTVIGMGSVVTKDIPAGVVAAGNPARILRPVGPEDDLYYAKGRKVEL